MVHTGATPPADSQWSEALGLSVDEAYAIIEHAVRCIVRSGTDDERQEITQQTWLRVLVALRRQEQKIVHPRRWLFRAAEHTCSNLRFRSTDALGRSRWEQFDDYLVWRQREGIARPDSIFQRRQLAQLIIDRFSARQRFICCCSAWGYSGQDIAKRIGRTPPIVTRELKRVRTLIRDNLDAGGQDPSPLTWNASDDARRDDLSS